MKMAAPAAIFLSVMTRDKEQARAMYPWSVVLRSALLLLLLCQARIAGAEIQPYALLWVESHSDAFPVHDLV